MLHETKDHYISIGYYGPSNKIGVHIFKYDKKTGDLVNRSIFYYQNKWVFVGNRSRIYDTGSHLKFAVAGNNHIFQLNFDYINNEVIIADTIINLQNEAFIINDFEMIGDSAIYYSKIGDNIGWINRHNNETKYTYLNSMKPRNLCQRHIRLNNGNYLFFGGKNNSSINRWRIAVTEVDMQGNIVWEVESTNNASFSVADILQIDSSNILILTSADALDQVTNNNGFYRILYNFDLRSKKLTRLLSCSNPTYIGMQFGKIVKSVRDTGCYFICTSTPMLGVTRDSFINGGRILKIKKDGSVIWTKDYAYAFKHYQQTQFMSMISTYDRNYLLGGEVGNTWVNGLLVKIDEDGNILPIDTTSSTQNQAPPDISTHIKIYPNPASQAIIINQGEIADMTYTLIDMTGAVIQSLPMPYPHHNTVWDISDVPSGSYVISMMQSGKVIGTIKQIVVK